MSRGLRIVQLMEEFDEMPERRLLLEFQSLNHSVYVFNKNFLELERFSVFLINDTKAEWLTNRDQFLEVGREIIRLVHNFVASALSLIDHTRRIFNKFYRDTGRFPEYQQEVQNVFANDPLSQFVQDLRRYCQHYKAPNISFFEYAEKGQDKFTRSIELPLENLQEFSDWSAPAKKYLQGIEAGVDILQVATIYQGKVIEFYEWFQKRQFEIHEVEIKRFREKETQLLILQLEEHLDLALANADFRRGSRDEAFLQILTPHDFEILEKISPTSNERPARAIELLEKYLHVSHETKEKIYKLYKHSDLFASREFPSGDQSDSEIIGG